MTMVATLVWSGRKTSAWIIGCTDGQTERQVMGQSVETGGQYHLVVDSRVGFSRLIVAPDGMPFRDRWAVMRYVPALNFRINRLSVGRHGEIMFGNGKGGEMRKLGLRLQHIDSYTETNSVCNMGASFFVIPMYNCN